MNDGPLAPVSSNKDTRSPKFASSKEINITLLNQFQEVTESLQIYPACLPFKERSTVDAFHSGWSRPIPYHIFRNFSSGYTEIYDEFFKQVHYKMEVLEECRDSNLLEDTFLTAQFRTDTYYPAGQD